MAGSADRSKLKSMMVFSLAIVLVVLTVVAWPCIDHNRQLSELERLTAKIELPGNFPDSFDLGTSSDLGNLFGTSNQCNYLVRRFVVTTLTPVDFKRLVKYPEAFGGPDYEVVLRYIGTADELAYKPLFDGGHVFLFEATGGSSEPGWDVRCH